LAGQYRALLLAPVADYGVELRGAVGLLTELTDANKEDLLRRACAAKLVGDRVQAWEALQAGFVTPGAGGAEVLAAVRAATGADVAAQSRTLRGLVHGTAVRSVREQARAARASENAASEAALQELTTPCPRCGVRLQRAGGCFHMKCPCGNHFYDCCGRNRPPNRLGIRSREELDPDHPSDFRCPFTKKSC
jgi:hypothetical protein